jgi:arginase family enzyme
VEFKSIELTTACLELDGLIYNGSVLKILRANEYKPELVPASTRPPIKLHLPASAFGAPTSGTNPLHPGGDSPSSSLDLRLDYSFIHVSPLTTVERDAIVIIGFPYDDSTRRSTGRAGSSMSPKAVRNIIRKTGAGTLVNPEFGVDLSDVAIYDVGDITPGLPIEEANARLASAVAEIVRRGAIPFVLGGSCELCYGLAVGVMAVAGGSLGVVSISSQLDVKPPLVTDTKCHNGGPYRQLLEDTRFCPPRSGLFFHSCEGRFVVFGAQGASCPYEQAKYVIQRGGRVVWLSKDLRQPQAIFGPSGYAHEGGGTSRVSGVDGGTGSVSGVGSAGSGNSSGVGGERTSSPTPRAAASVVATPQMHFQRVIESLGEHAATGARRPVYVSFNAGCMAYSACPGSLTTAASSLGFTADEVLDMAMMAGADANVVAMDVCELLPEIEEARSARLLTDIFYRFAAGVAIRLLSSSAPTELQLAPPSRSGSAHDINSQVSVRTASVSSTPATSAHGVLSEASIEMHIQAYQQQQQQQQQKLLRMQQQQQQQQQQGLPRGQDADSGQMSPHRAAGGSSLDEAVFAQLTLAQEGSMVGGGSGKGVGVGGGPGGGGGARRFQPAGAFVGTDAPWPGGAGGLRGSGQLSRQSTPGLLSTELPSTVPYDFSRHGTPALDLDLPDGHGAFDSGYGEGNLSVSATGGIISVGASRAGGGTTPFDLSAHTGSVDTTAASRFSSAGNTRATTYTATGRGVRFGDSQDDKPGSLDGSFHGSSVSSVEDDHRLY